MMHQYIDRKQSAVVTEKIFHDKLINFIYSDIRENAATAFKLITSQRFSALIASVVYDFPAGQLFSGSKNFIRSSNIDLSEIFELEKIKTQRDFFERKIRYWECRPMDDQLNIITSPADSRILIGSFENNEDLFIKEKFFSFDELLGSDKTMWKRIFRNGSYAIFRLTPDKYHWSHFPVSGRIIDFYEIEGACHSCNPSAIVKEITPYSKNKRTVTVIDTDISGGSRCGMVSMIEVTAMMIGAVEQRYSLYRYENPVPIRTGMMVYKGTPKSVYRPGSSVDILIFEKDRVQFSHDLLENRNRVDVISRYSDSFKTPLVETDIAVRSTIGYSK